MVVKGVRFKDLQVEGDPAELSSLYEEQGADEIVFLDITASYEKRGTLLQAVERTADTISIPFTVGGGVRNIDDMRKTLWAGADKVSINTAAIRNPQLIKEGADIFGSQCVVVAIDARRAYVPNPPEDRITEKTPQGLCWWEVNIEGGRKPTGIDAVAWAVEAERLGAGEILLTSMDYDGTQEGYDVPLTQAVATRVNVPIIASGGAGNPTHMLMVLTEGKADAALAASIFHRSKFSVGEVKKFLAEKGVPVRQ